MEAIEVHVAIVGSGPAGLAAALSLLKVFQQDPAFKVAVFDKATSFRSVGAAIGLAPNGQAALGAFSPEALQAVLIRSANFKERVQLNANGERVEGWGRDPGKVVLVPWYDVQKALMDIVIVSGVKIYTGHRFQGMDEDQEGITVTFENGSRVRCKLLIGADGALSKVRAAALLPTDQPPAYIGIAACRAIIDLPSWWPYPDTLVGCNMHMMMLPLLDGKLSWACSAPYPEDKMAQLKDPEQIKQWCFDICKLCGGTPDGPAAFLHRLVDKTPASGILLQFVYGREALGPLQPWGRGKVTLVGDAAHVIHPWLGQGTSLAFEDAAELGHAVAKHGLCPEAFREYENTRLERVQHIAERTHAHVSFQKAQAAASGRYSLDHLRAGADMSHVPKVLQPEELASFLDWVRDKHFEPVPALMTARRLPAAQGLTGTCHAKLHHGSHAHSKVQGVKTQALGFKA